VYNAATLAQQEIPRGQRFRRPELDDIPARARKLTPSISKKGTRCR
jgi:hypothetical protein